MIEEYSKSRLPILMIGEIGTGKDKVASLLDENGPFDSSPFYKIDCEFMNERKWNTLISSDNSPLNSLHSTIYIKNPGALSKNQAEKLFLYLEQTNLAKRNRLLFSLVLNSDQYPETTTVRDYLKSSVLPNLKASSSKRTRGRYSQYHSPAFAQAERLLWENRSSVLRQRPWNL